MIIPESLSKLTEGRRKKCSKKICSYFAPTSDLGPQTTSVAPLHYARPSWEIAIASRR